MAPGGHHGSPPERVPLLYNDPNDPDVEEEPTDSAFRLFWEVSWGRGLGHWRSSHVPPVRTADDLIVTLPPLGAWTGVKSMAKGDLSNAYPIVQLCDLCGCPMWVLEC